jgi:hypothetical protein
MRTDSSLLAEKSRSASVGWVACIRNAAHTSGTARCGRQADRVAHFGTLNLQRLANGRVSSAVAAASGGGKVVEVNVNARGR